MSETTKILPCTCNNEFQDKTYGTKLRLHNRCGSAGAAQGKKTGSSANEYRCTVCAKTKSP